jgi:uncharacterized OB-fold protein
VSPSRHPLDIQRCSACGACWTLRPYACASCGGTELQWIRASGAGVVTAKSEVMRAPDSFWRAHVPYTLVLVRLDEGPVLMAHAQEPSNIGDRVTGTPVEIEGRTLLRFSPRPAPAAGAA